MSSAAFGARSTALEVVQGIHLAGQQAIVNGGASGLGLATSRALAGHGGLYLEDCGIGVPQPASNRVSGFSPHVADPEGAQRLWAVSQALLAQA